MTERRYRRTASPASGARRMINPEHSSTGSLGYPFYDRYYPPSRLGRDVRTSPRGSGELSPTDLQASQVYRNDPPSPLSAYYGRRPRRATLEDQGGGRPRPLVTAGLRPIVHGSGLESPRAISKRTPISDSEEDYYISPATSGQRRHHRRNFSVEEANMDRLIRRSEQRDPAQSRSPNPGTYRKYGKSDRAGGYHFTGPSARQPGRGDDGYRYDGHQASRYGQTTGGDPYWEPISRRHRAESLDAPQRGRPISMMELEPYLPRPSDPREARPPPPSNRANERLPRGSPVESRGYEEPPERNEMEHGRGPSQPTRRRPVSLHQSDHERHARRPNDVPNFREREEAHRHHHQPTERADPRKARATGELWNEHETRDYSSDASSERDEESNRQHHRHPRQRRHHDEEGLVESPSHIREAPERASAEPESRHRPPYPPDLVRPAESRDRQTLSRDTRDKELNGRAQDRPTPTPREHGLRGQDELERETRGSKAYEPEPRQRDPQHDVVRDRDVARLNQTDRDVGREYRGEDPYGQRKTIVEAAPTNDRAEHVRVVSPPREKDVKGPLKGILREPRQKFPEDPAPVREGVAPLKEALKDGRKGIPPGARWTKIDRKRVNPAALKEAHERFEERPDHVIVLRVLTRDEIEALAARTQEIRGTVPASPETLAEGLG